MERGHIEQIQKQKLGCLLDAVSTANPFYRQKLSSGSGVSPTPRASQRDQERPLVELLDELPLTTKTELERDQLESPPYGTNLTFEPARYSRLHQTSGTTGKPLRWLDTPQSWSWILNCWDEVYQGVGLQRDDRVLFPFSFGPFLGFWSGFEAASRRSSFIVPAGGLTTLARLRLIETHAVTVVVCTPTYALHMAEVAAAEGVDLPGSSVRELIVAGEPGGNVATTKERIEEGWGARCFDHCGMTEIGAYGFERDETRGNLHVIESEFIVEVLKPGGTERVGDGNEGELVLTNLGRTGSPLLRYRTGDLVRWTTDPGPGGVYGRLLGGILSRLDDMIIVRGNNVYPSAIEDVVRAFREVAEYRVVVGRSAALAELVVEIEPVAVRGAGQDCIPQLVQRVREGLERRLLFRVDVRAVASGVLPRFELKGKRMIREEPDEPSSS